MTDTASEASASNAAQLSTATGELRDLLADMARETSAGDDHSDEQGVSLLAVENASLLHYNMQVAALALRMTAGRPTASSPCTRTAAAIRRTLERIHPVEDRMRSELDKLVTAATETKRATTTSDEPRARPDLMTATAAGSDDEGDDVAEQSTPSGLYVPPKVMPMHYTEDIRGTRSREEKDEEASRRRAMNSSLIRELHEQYTDAPVEIVDASDVKRKRQVERERERKVYEESNYTRLVVSAKQAQRERTTAATDTLASLLDFGDYGMGAQVSAVFGHQPICCQEAKRAAKRSGSSKGGKGAKRGKFAKKGGKSGGGGKKKKR